MRMDQKEVGRGIKRNSGWDKRRLTAVNMQNKEFIPVLSLINCVIVHMNNCKPTFV